MLILDDVFHENFWRNHVFIKELANNGRNMGFFVIGIGHEETTYNKAFRNSNDFRLFGDIDAESLETVFKKYFKHFSQFSNGRKGKERFLDMWNGVMMEQHPTEIDPENRKLRRMYNFIVVNLATKTHSLQDSIFLAKETRGYDPKACFIGNYNIIEYFKKHWKDEMIEIFKKKDREEERKKREKKRLIRMGLNPDQVDFYASQIAKNSESNYYDITNQVKLVDSSKTNIKMQSGPAPPIDISLGPLLQKHGRRKINDERSPSNKSTYSNLTERNLHRHEMKYNDSKSEKKKKKKKKKNKKKDKSVDYRNSQNNPYDDDGVYNNDPSGYEPSNQVAPNRSKDYWNNVLADPLNDILEMM